eukprot:scaffold20884_cov150-Skeletonema_dohrnii-CCMP3373.AAC.1
MTTEKHNRCVFTSEDEESLSPEISPFFSSLPSSPKASQSTFSSNDRSSPGGCSLSNFDWGVTNHGNDLATASAAAVQYESESSTKNNDVPLFLSSEDHNGTLSCPGGMQPPLMVQRNVYPSFYSAQLPSTHHHYLAAANTTTNNVDNNNSMMSSLQPSHPQANNTAAAHWNTSNNETAQLYAQLFQAQADYAVMQQQFSGFVAENTPSSTLEAVNHSSVNNAVASPLTSNNNTACGSGFSYGNHQQQVQQLDQAQRSQMVQGGPQVDYHLKQDDPSQQLHCGLITSGIVKSNNFVDPNIIQNHPTRLSIPSDEQFLDPVYNFLRSACIEVFVATDENDTGGRGRGTQAIGQVGLRCVHCKNIQRNRRANQAVSYPSRTTNIFESVRNYQRIHLEACEHIPSEFKTKYRELVSQSYRKIHLKYIKVYFAEAACEIGMVQTPNGLFFGAPPNTSGKPSEKLLAIMCIAENPTASEHKQLRDLIFPKVDDRLVNSKFSHIASLNTRQVIANCRQERAVFVYPSDFPIISDFRFVLFHQFLPCRPPKSALSRRRTKPDKWDTLSGLYCKHCAKAHPGERYLKGMYFPLDLESLCDSSLPCNLECHIMTCQYVPFATKEALDELQRLAAEYGVITKRNAKKTFLQQLWKRISNYYPSPGKGGEGVSCMY